MSQVQLLVPKKKASERPRRPLTLTVGESEGPTEVGHQAEGGGRDAIMTGIRDRISREDGVAAVEFALILPVLALLLFGVLEFGRAWSQYQMYQGAAREGAQCAAVAPPRRGARRTPLARTCRSRGLNPSRSTSRSGTT